MIFREGSLVYIRRRLNFEGSVQGRLVGLVVEVLNKTLVLDVLVSDYQGGFKAQVFWMGEDGVRFLYKLWLDFVLEFWEIQVGELPIYVSYPYKMPLFDRMLKGVV